MAAANPESKASQIERFRATARFPGTDQDAAAPQSKLGVIARPKPKDGSTAAQN